MARRPTPLTQAPSFAQTVSSTYLRGQAPRPPAESFAAKADRDVFGRQAPDLTDPAVNARAAAGLRQFEAGPRALSRYERKQPPRPTSSITAQFHRAHGLSLPLQANGWPDPRDVLYVTDLPADDRVNVRRGSAGYLPFVEKLTGVPTEYMQILLGKESARDTLDERNPESTATGPGQLIDTTAIALFRRHSKALGGIGSGAMSRTDVLNTVRTDRRWALGLTAQYQMDNAQWFRGRYQKNPTWRQMREMHFFGATEEFLNFNAARDTDDATTVVSPRTAWANRTIFYNTYVDGMGKAQADITRPRTVGEVRAALGRGMPDREFDVGGAPPEDGPGPAQGGIETPWPPAVFQPKSPPAPRARTPLKSAINEDEVTRQLNEAEAARLRSLDVGNPES